MGRKRKKAYKYNYFTRIMLKIDSLTKQISRLYNELKGQERPDVREKIGQNLVQLCKQAEIICQREGPHKFMHKKAQICKIRQKAEQNLKEINQAKLKKGQSSDVSTYSKYIVKKPENSVQFEKTVCRIIIEKEVKSQELKISDSELQQIALRMEKNQEFQKQIKSLIQDQGSDLQKIETKLDQVYENIAQANQDLNTAAQMNFRRVIGNLRLGITAVLSTIGYKILGFPGLIFGGVLGLFRISH